MKKQKEMKSAPGGYDYPATMNGEKVGISMQRSAGDQVQQEMVASEIASETPQEAAYTRVDQYTLEVIQQIFPAPNKGLEFTAGVLHYAQIMQNVLPGLEDMGEHVAVINVKTIRILATLIDWGYDTTHKYVTTFCALGLLRKIKQGAERLLVFPLERYVLPINLQPLDNLIAKSRPKVQQFARQVKMRLSQLNPAALTQSNTTFEGHRVPSGDSIYQSIFGVMESEGIDPATSRHLSKRIINEVLSQFDIAMLTIQAHDETYEQAATGTLASRQLASSFTAPRQSSHAQSRQSQYQTESTNQQAKYPVYQAEPSQYQTESTDRQGKYPVYQTESSQYQIESTDRQGKYPRNYIESTPESSAGRLSGAEVSTWGRLSPREVSQSPIEGKTRIERSSAPRVSRRPAREQVWTSRKKVMRPEARPYTGEEMLSHIMTDWDMLTSYEYIVRENLIDWEADGLPSEFIEQVYQEIYTVNAGFAQRGMIVTSRNFFLSVVEKRAIDRLTRAYKLDFINVYNLILCRTNRERLTIAALPEQPSAPLEDLFDPNHRSQPGEQYQASHAHSTRQPEYDQLQPAKHDNKYQGSADAHASKYRAQVDPRNDEYQAQVDSYTNKYRAQVDPRDDEYQAQVDSYAEEYQDGVDLDDSEYQGEVDPKQVESTRQRPLGDESTYPERAQTGADELDAQESTPQLSLGELIDRAALADGLTRLRIPRALNKQNYTSDFWDVYVTYNIKKLIIKLLDDVTLRNDGKMFFAEIFDTARAGAAKNWYNKLFTRSSSPESLLAAFIETIIDLHSRGNATIQNPGALFNKKIAECEKVINDGTRENIKVYGELCYEDFILEIARLASRESLGIR